MLKIKEGIELKELKKFGIKEAPDVKGHYGLCKKWNNSVWYYTIMFEEPDREIRIVNWNKQTGDVLYDLIQARISRESRGVEYERRRDEKGRKFRT